MAPLKLDADTKVKADFIITENVNGQQKAMDEIRANGGDREAMHAKRKELSDARDVRLKTIFTEAQMKQWKDEIEPSMRPQRPAGAAGAPAPAAENNFTGEYEQKKSWNLFCGAFLFYYTTADKQCFENLF